MRLGTPLSPTATKVMLLGSGELGKEVVIELQRLGVEVIAVDRYENAPGQQVAHRAHVINMTDAAALRALVEKERPDFIVPEIEAIATDELVRIEADKLAIVIPTAFAAHTTMNRERIRVLAAEKLGLPCSPYAFASSLEELQAAVDRIGFPCFVKPVMSSSGKGQSRLKSQADVAPAWDKALTAGRVKEARVIIEGEVKFDFEITQLTVRSANGTHFCDPIGHVQVDGDYVESWQPQAMTAAAIEKSRDMAKKVTDALGGRGIFGVELFVKGDDVWFSEVSPRPHDTGLVTLVSQYQSEFALHARAILGLPVSTALKSPGASAVVYGGMEAKGIAFDGVAEALADPDTELRLFGKPESFKKRRMGVALARGTTTDDARKRAKQAASLVKPVQG
ncbi:MAG TPA: formate-dependent phosphoribosylglycinamide formyltransferase [Rhizomicrobium sp.]|jgi:phosphoribosylglycinamide formyltransferase 2|nr:formate-dependent phosphoribosylglycinamide formyltransferase [Rhizomicrobium sp.]